MDINSTSPEKQLDAMRAQISSSLEKAQAQKNTLKRNNSRYITASIILAALATFLAGIAGTIGNHKSWKPICLFAAVCSAGVTVTTKLQTVDQLTEASECLGQLKSLRIETITPKCDLEEVSTKYQQILSEYSMIDI
jgi:hypothetical protein